MELLSALTLRFGSTRPSDPRYEWTDSTPPKKEWVMRLLAEQSITDEQSPQ
jgi:hypothetical protein